MSNDIRQTLPNTLQELYIAIVTAKGVEHDITRKVTNFTMYESIHDKFLSGRLTLVDNSDLFSLAPIIGQEFIFVTYKFKETTVEHAFRATDIEDAKELNNNTGAYVINFVSDKQFLNATQVFSRSYKGRNTEIIAKVHRDFLKEEVDVQSIGGTSHQLIYPYIKPYQAIDMVLTNTFAADRTPLFLYDTVNNTGTKLKSLGDMMSDSDPIKLQNIIKVNDDRTGDASRNIVEQANSVEEQVIKSGYQTLHGFSKGLFAASITTVDPSNKTFTEDQFDYKKHTPTINSQIEDYISEGWTVNNKAPNETYAARDITYLKDSKAFESVDVGNINQVDSISLASMRSYAMRMDNQKILVISDNVPELEVGRLVELNFRRMAPNLDSDEDRDLVNSGLYLCSAIKHVIKGSEYRMFIEAIRNGISKEAGE
jgi:hypothetical protein